ncbi:MAG: DUF5329 family protein [Desulfobacterales bacterium]|nr:DUF5329 domain-containing protein [Deltaproteobacteria bacterium]NNK93431.1 DUF5329 family protein [Desulfobacterales bacterium]
MKRQNACALLVLFFLLLPWCEAAANMTEASEQEITHLLDYIGNSECSFIRNDTTYSKARAREHILRKYTYIKTKITTTEQFIEHAASQSSITKVKYLVRCNDVTSSTESWLEQELSAYRLTVSFPASQN